MKSRKAKHRLAAALHGVAVGVGVLQGLVWVSNPELTQMQFFLKTWYFYVVILAAASVATWLDKR